MADPYWRYAAPADTTGSAPNLTFPGYLQRESSPLASQHLRNTNDLQGASTDYLQKDVLPLNTGGIDHDLGHRRDVALGLTPAIPDIVNERPVSSVKVDSFPNATGESSILFVDGLPNDCTRREVGHLFRPFIGFKDIKVVHKEPRHSEDKAMVLCFVEFDDAKCALTALEALQGYKFDYKKPNSPCLRIHFARFPFRLPSGCDEQRFGGGPR